VAAVNGWQRPARCDSSACPEVRIGLTDVTLRFTSNPDMHAVGTLEEWQQLCEAIKAEDFPVGESPTS
jgi:hypothetical protein